MDDTEHLHVEHRRMLPPGVYGGDVYLDETGSSLVIYGIDGRVHIIFDDTMARSLTPQMARSVAQQIVDAAEIMEWFPQRESDQMTVNSARWAMTGKQASTRRP